jgi:hypothetical protein
VTRQKLRRVRSRGLAYSARCSEACSGHSELDLSARAARRARLPRVLGRQRVAIPVRTALTPLRVHLGKTARRALGRHPRTLRATLRVVVADADGNKRSVARPVLVSR